jgi:1-acyl-sn-glycerol-3-phosphate acyltransferase
VALVSAQEIEDRVDRLELPFNRFGVDTFGISKKHLKTAMTVLGFLYRNYFSVDTFGIQNVPPRGRAMLVGNHSGGVALDGAMVVAAMFLEMNPPRLAQGMAEKFLAKIPLASLWTSRTGQFVGLPEHAVRLLEDERLLLVFPEGARGTAKLFPERHTLVDFGTGFVRLAMQTRSPIVPFSFLGGGDAIPTIYNARTLGKLLGMPYVPLTPYLFTLPLPVRLQIYFHEPLLFDGNGTEDDEVIQGHVETVKAVIARGIELGKRVRNRELLPPSRGTQGTQGTQGNR